MTAANKDTPPIEYKGETARRRPAIASILTLLHPALGYLYVGQGRAAVVSTIAFTLYLALFLTLCVALEVLPVLPAAAFVLGWVVMVVMCMIGIVGASRREGSSYVLKGYNHPVVYTLLFVGIALIPIYASTHIATEVIWSTVDVTDAGMYPTALPGDVLLVERRAFVGEEPERGELVVVSGADRDGRSASALVGRVVALSGDLVEFDGESVRVNDEPLARQIFTVTSAEDEEAIGRVAKYIENNAGSRYLVAGPATLPPRRSTSTTITVSEGSILILGDNRSGKTTRLQFGAVSTDRIIGAPRYVLYSETPEAEGDTTPERRPQTRWDRVGYRIR